MTIFGLDIQTWIFIILGLGQFIYAALTYHRDRRRVMSQPTQQPKRPLVIIGLFMVLTWAAAGVDIYSRSHAASVAYGDLPIPAWGVNQPQTYYLVLDTRPLLQYADKNKLMLIVRVPYSDRDMMTDTVIEKSIAYTIRPGALTLAVPSQHILRFVLGVETPVEYDLVMVPASIGPDDIKSLGDVVRLGGKLLTSRGTAVTGAPPPPDKSN